MLLELDPRTLLFVASLLCSIILFILHRSFPASIGGLASWSQGCLASLLPASCLACPASFPIFFAIIVASALVAGGTMRVYAGFLQFAEEPAKTRLLILWLSLLMCFIAWFTYVAPSYPMRSLMVAGTNCVLYASCTALIVKTSGNTLAGRFTAVVFFILSLTAAIRVPTLLFQLDVPATVITARITSVVMAGKSLLHYFRRPRWTKPVLPPSVSVP